MNIDTRIACLRDEYLFLQKTYEDFDARAITMKGWSATIGLTAIGAAFYQSPFLWPFAALASLVFWGIETTWKGFQYAYAPRIALLEKVFLTQEFDDVAPFQIYTSWFDVVERSGFRFMQHMRLGVVMFPHVIIIVAGVTLFLLEALGVMVIPRK
jgi:hypothetical protein